MANFLDIILGRNLGSFFTPGINPNAPPIGGNAPSGSLGAGGVGPAVPPRPTGVAPAAGLQAFNERFNATSQSPAFQLGMNLLANSGPSVVPRSFGQIVGQSIGQTAQQQQSQTLADLQRKLIESQIGLNSARSQQTPDQFEVLSEEEKSSLNLDPKKSFKRNAATGEVSQIGSSGITVDARNFGNIPQGFELQETNTGARLSPIPGGPAAREIEERERQQEERQASESSQANLITQEIDRAITEIDSGGLPETGFGSFLSGIPGTGAQKLSNNLKTIRANIGFQELQQMRENSPTGGALGNITIGEIERLEAIAGSLDQSQTSDELKFNLNRLWNEMQDVIHGPGNGPSRRALREDDEFAGFAIVRDNATNDS
jgi:hypothetical protein